MKTITNQNEYEKAIERMEQLLKVVSNETPETDKNFIELNIISDLIADYEEKKYPLKP